MTVQELLHKCKNENCRKCPYEKQCNKMYDLFHGGVSPEEIPKFLKYELD